MVDHRCHSRPLLEVRFGSNLAARSRSREWPEIVKGFRTPASDWREGVHGGRRPKTLNYCGHSRDRDPTAGADR